MIKHTPGPWVVKATMIGAASSVKVIGTKDGDLSDQEAICFVPQTNEAQVANTRLVQAAPDLLEACRLIVGAFDALEPGSSARNEPLQINAARAAIAKATLEAA